MTYSISISILFDLPRVKVYEALNFLDNYPLWNQNILCVSKSGRLVENMIIEMESMVGDKLVSSNLEIIKLIPNESIEMINNSGVISYRIIYQLLDMAPNESELICMVQFAFRNFSMDLARPGIEAMAGQRIRTNLTNLKVLLES